jgi:two-component system response regulator
VNARPIQVLLVEDNEDDVKLALHALQSNGVDEAIHVVGDGVEALDFLFGEQAGGQGPANLPRLVLLDLKLPRLNGLEVLKKIKADPRTREVPVVMLTASGEEKDLVESYHLGVNGYIVKPVDFEQFQKAMGSVARFWLHVNQPRRG